MILDDAHEVEVDEENYFVSMTDMMVGLVFIFIIMLMYFALQFQDITDKMTGADRERAVILKQLEQTLRKKGSKSPSTHRTAFCTSLMESCSTKGNIA